MKMSQLCETSGVPVPSIKYYLREGLLPAGERTSATQAEYGAVHVERLKLIRALIDVGGLSVATAHRVLEAIDTPDLPLTYLFGIAQLSVSDTSLYEDVDPASPGALEVDATVQRMGWAVSEENPGLRGAARILNTYTALGYSDLAHVSEEYADAAELVAKADLAAVGRRATVEDMAETVVVGTVLGDGLFAALRRIAQEHISNTLFPAPRG
jgi:DNA-binding transcriptional MerR regulator